MKCVSPKHSLSLKLVSQKNWCAQPKSLMSVMYVNSKDDKNNVISAPLHVLVIAFNIPQQQKEQIHFSSRGSHCNMSFFYATSK